MEERDIVLTTEGYNKLEEELKYLKGPKKMQVAERIKIAREFGDLSENSEYDDAKNEQALLEAKIQDIENTSINLSCEGKPLFITRKKETNSHISLLKNFKINILIRLK